jgi:hypothetical protein
MARVADVSKNHSQHSKPQTETDEVHLRINTPEADPRESKPLIAPVAKRFSK